MNTVETSILSGDLIYTTQQVGSVGNIPIFTFPGVDMPIEDFFIKNTEVIELEQPVVLEDINVLELAQKHYKEHKENLLRKYKSKYIAILNNKVVGSGKDFSKLAQRVYKKYGYQTIYMPFVDIKEKVVRIPSPRIKAL